MTSPTRARPIPGSSRLKVPEFVTDGEAPNFAFINLSRGDYGTEARTTRPEPDTATRSPLLTNTAWVGLSIVRVFR